MTVASVQVEKLRNALRRTREQFAGAQAMAEDLDSKRRIAQAEAQRWRLACQEARRACDLMSHRHDALVAALPEGVSAVLRIASVAAWDEGWEAAHGGFDKAQNPYVAPAETARR